MGVSLRAYAKHRGVSDTAVMVLFSFLSKFFKLTAHNFNERNIIHYLSVGIPQTLQGAFHMIGIDKDNFIH